MTVHEIYIQRCLELAALGIGRTAPNPMVGAVLVHDNRIIGEGYHLKYGEAHAEVNCIRSVKKMDESYIQQSILYVSLEPCVHFGKTPPCTDLIIDKGIPTVIVGCLDPFQAVNGKGIEKLKSAGVKVTVGILEDACREINKRFFVFQTRARPFVILKWAQSANAKIARADRSRVLISNEFSNRLVHRWRAEEASVLVGRSTALLDNPSLSVRLWEGPNPIRMVIDRNLQLPHSLRLFDHQQATVIFNSLKHGQEDGISYQKLENGPDFIRDLLERLFELNIQSVLVEGGAILLQSFIDLHSWDEARIISNELQWIEPGLAAPELNLARLADQQMILSDEIRYYRRS